MPVSVKKTGTSILLAIIPFFIATGMGSSILQNPEINVTVLEWKDYTTNMSKTTTIIQNVGNSQSKNISVLYDAPFEYHLTSFNSTESVPKQIDDPTGKLRIAIDRLSSESYLIVENEGKFVQNTSKTIWITSDSEKEILKLENTIKNIGITSMSFVQEKYNSLMIEGGFGLALLLGFRYTYYHKAEFMRRKFFGVYNFKSIKYRSKLFGSFTIIILTAYGAAYVDFYNEPSPQNSYNKYEAFPLDVNINPDRFLQFKDPKVYYQASAGNLILGFAIFVAILYSISDIKSPTTIWSHSLPHSEVSVSQISGSYTPSKIVSINTKQRSFPTDIEIYVVKDDQKIVGLLSRNEIMNLEIGVRKLSFRTMLKRKHLGTPKWNDEKLLRDNFHIVRTNMTLDSIKVELDKNHKRFAVIMDTENSFVGVIDYENIFGKQPFSYTDKTGDSKKDESES